MSTSMYAAFKTNQNVEQEGVWVDYGQFRVRVARAGGSNKKFSRIFETKMRPYQRALKTETIDNDTVARLLREAYVDGIITGWQTKKKAEDGKTDVWKDVVVLPDGSEVPSTKDAWLKVLEETTELFLDIQNMSTTLSLYRDEVLEANAGN